MMLAELLRQAQTQGGVPEGRVKDLQTSVRYLAGALGYPSPDDCPADALLAPDWKACVSAYLGQRPRPVSPHTVRNTRQNLSQLRRAAQSLALLRPDAPLSPPLPARKQAERDSRRSTPYQARKPSRPYVLSLAAWPPAIRRRWSAYRQERSLKLRPITLDTYQQRLGAYLGCLTTVQNARLSAWGDLFQVAYLDRFIRWHSQLRGVRMSAHARDVTAIVLHLARYTDQPTTAALERYTRDLPRPTPMHHKQSHWLTLQELEQVGLALLRQAHIPVTTPGRYSGLTRTLKHQMALILRLLVRVPLRRRNVRSMQLGRNLYQDRGQWHLSFAGDELKIAHRRGHTNTFHLNLSDHCPDLIPHLDEYLQRFRPRHKHADVSPYVFLTQYGSAFPEDAISAELKAHIYQHTRRHFYPHLIRTIWATEFISKTGDFTTAAYMLNDTVQTVLHQYHEILDKDHAQKASTFLKHTLG